jgi:hypothetical protein
MHTNPIGPATLPSEAAMWFYQEAMLTLNSGNRADPNDAWLNDVSWLLEMGAKCAVIAEGMRTK